MCKKWDTPTHSHAFALINMEQKIAAIAGTAHAGEIRHAVFSFVNYLLPHEAVLPMRCAVNVGKAGDTAVFIGREGSGKTTLSLDSERILIGDHEHGWNDKGLFGFERGGYARVLNLSEKEEPELFGLTRKFE
jgi:phosphoenolpyruvate carboxykinase (ATP)